MLSDHLVTVAYVVLHLDNVSITISKHDEQQCLMTQHWSLCTSSCDTRSINAGRTARYSPLYKSYLDGSGLQVHDLAVAISSLQRPIQAGKLLRRTPPHMAQRSCSCNTLCCQPHPASSTPPLALRPAEPSMSFTGRERLAA